MVNKESLKVSKKAKEFLKNIKINRIKSNQKPLESFSESIELIQNYFKSHNDEYLKMLKGDFKNV